MNKESSTKMFTVFMTFLLVLVSLIVTTMARQQQDEIKTLQFENHMLQLENEAIKSEKESQIKAFIMNDTQL